MLDKAKKLLSATRERVLDEYGDEIGRDVTNVVTPALILDLPTASRNITHMAEEISKTRAGIRPHIKTHKSPDLAYIQQSHGILGLSTASVWEVVVMAAAGFDNIFLVNTVADPARIEALLEVARERNVMLAVDDATNAEQISRRALACGVEIGVVLEIDTGMDRAGVDTARTALETARVLQNLPGLRFEGLTGYEGHCSGVVDPKQRAHLHGRAMEVLSGAAETVIAAGIPVNIRSAGGTTTWRETASYPGITEIQAGTYVVMDNFHGRMVKDFDNALTVATTVISRPPDRVIVDAGNKSVAVPHLATLRGLDLPNIRFDEEHGVFGLSASIPPALGTRLQIIPGYAPSTINMFDAFHVAKEGKVVDIWPVIPRGPGHHGLA